MKPTLILIVSCLSLVTGVAQQKKQRAATGLIYGTVVSQDGQPGKRIWLMAEPLDVGTLGRFPVSRSNDRGEYRFENLPVWGKYTVYAEDDEAGYSGELTDDSSERSQIEISPAHPKAEFRVVLPRKAGFLEIHPTNRRTGAAIPWMGVSVARAEVPRQPVSHTCKSSELILVPPDRYLLLHVVADDFLEWDESAGTGKVIFVPSGTRLTLPVQLDPVQ
jgi:hypothetical protein